MAATALSPETAPYPWDDPLRLIAFFWPKVRIYGKQAEILYSVRDNDCTVVRAANMVGKDFVAGLAVLYFFLSRTPARVLTTSVDGDQLEDVLWGEIRRFLRTASMPLPIKENHLHLRKILPDGSLCPISSVTARVAKKGEGFQGRHTNAEEVEIDDEVPRSMIVFDEASAIEDVAFDMAETWADRMFIFGNPLATTNRFYKASKAGDKYSVDGSRCYVKTIRIRAEDSPNVIAKKRVLPGVIAYEEYVKRRETWDKLRQCVALDGEFYEGSELLLFPPDWLIRAEQVAQGLKHRKGVTMGIDGAEGGDNTVWTVVDYAGVIYQLSLKTPDTSEIPTRTLALMREYGITAENVLFDRGGGGKQHADYLRKKGYNVRTVAFGDPATSASDRQRQPGFPYSNTRRREEAEERYAYKNRRAEMYGLSSDLLNPLYNPKGFGIANEYAELRRQLSAIPRRYDPEGRLYLPAKKKRSRDSTEETMQDLVGCSPDEADSLGLAVFGLFNKGSIIKAGAL